MFWYQHGDSNAVRTGLINSTILYLAKKTYWYCFYTYSFFILSQQLEALRAIWHSCDPSMPPSIWQARVIGEHLTHKMWRTDAGHSRGHPCSLENQNITYVILDLSIDGFPNILDIVNPCFVLQTSRPLSVSFLICASRIRQTSRLGCSQPNTTFYVFVLANASQSAPPIVQLKISGRVSHLVLETITTFPGAKIVLVYISI